MGIKSRETLYGIPVRVAEEQAAAARRKADVLACEAWSKRMLGFKGPAQPSPMLGDALNAGYRYLEIQCAACDLHSTLDLTIVRRPKDRTPIHELERWLACKDCSRGHRSAVSAVSSSRYGPNRSARRRRRPRIGRGSDDVRKVRPRS